MILSMWILNNIMVPVHCTYLVSVSVAGFPTEASIILIGAAGTLYTALVSWPSFDLRLYFHFPDKGEFTFCNLVHNLEALISPVCICMLCYPSPPLSVWQIVGPAPPLPVLLQRGEGKQGKIGNYSDVRLGIVGRLEGCDPDRCLAVFCYICRTYYHSHQSKLRSRVNTTFLNWHALTYGYCICCHHQQGFIMAGGVSEVFSTYDDGYRLTLKWVWLLSLTCGTHVHGS